MKSSDPSDILVFFEVSLFRLGMISQEGYEDRTDHTYTQITGAYDFYDALVEYWEIE